MPVHRISLETEQKIWSWAKERFDRSPFGKTFDELIVELLAENVRLSRELDELGKSLSE